MEEYVDRDGEKPVCCLQEIERRGLSTTPFKAREERMGMEEQ